MVVEVDGVTGITVVPGAVRALGGLSGGVDEAHPGSRPNQSGQPSPTSSAVAARPFNLSELLRVTRPALAACYRLYRNR